MIVLCIVVALSKQDLRILLKADFCVIGGGTGGATFASAAAQLGARVILLEGDRMGGKSLYRGCIPSKALLAAAHQARMFWRAHQMGWTFPDSPIPCAENIWDYVHQVVHQLAPRYGADPLKKQGVNVVKGWGAFESPSRVVTETHRISARIFVLATGSYPFVPLIEGIESVPYLTSDNLFDLSILPEHLGVIGGGPVGVEMAQAFRQLGSNVTLLCRRFLPHCDAEAACFLKENLEEEGIKVCQGASVSDVKKESSHLTVTYQTSDQGEKSVRTSHLLIAAGHHPAVNRLNLDAADVNVSSQGIIVNHQFRTSNPRIYAIGDCTPFGGFTHLAEQQAHLLAKHLLFHWPIDYGKDPVSWVTYTDPEIAQVGPTTQVLSTSKTPHQVFKCAFQDNDRAHTQAATKGWVKVSTTKRGRIVGATLLGKDVGELLPPCVLAIQKKMRLKEFASLALPYPTRAEILKQVAKSAWKKRRAISRVHFFARFFQGMSALRWQGLWPLTLLLMGGGILWWIGAKHDINFESLQRHHETLEAWVAHSYIYSIGLYFAFYVGVVTFSMPVAGVMSLLGGFLFGPWVALPLVVGAVTLGSTLFFLAVRHASYQGFDMGSSKRFEHIRGRFKKNAFLYLLMLRLIPLTPFVMVNMVGALLRARLWTFVTSTALGILPGTFVYVYIGSVADALLDQSQLQWRDLINPEMAIGFLFLGVLGLIPFLYRKLRRKQR
jgi:pyruvate/2-oxoglutarate dehydrogenase complex dihydrolipoamide dehydrogenase (E3) component/uncharacterized membrane protein YdjX (TVP38/TMEM64 family)